jgi:hypothetical protein
MYCKISREAASPLSRRPQFGISALTVALTGLLLTALAGGAAAHAQDTSTLVVLHPTAVKGATGSGGPLKQSDITEIKVGGKVATITGWTTLLQTPDYKGPTTMQLVVLLDSMEQIGAANQFDELKAFFNHLPPNVEIAVGYLLQGKAKIAQPFTTDRSLLIAALHLQPDYKLPKNDNGGPYNCLRDLAAHWPSPDPTKLRAVFMITDGVDRYSQGASETLQPDVDSAAQGMLRAGIAGFSMYYLDPVPVPGRNEGGPMEGQSLLDQLATQTNGQAFYVGQFAPNSFEPMLQKFYAFLNSEVVATVTFKGSGYKTLDIKSSRTDVKISGPSDIMLGNVLGKK